MSLSGIPVEIILSPEKVQLPGGLMPWILSIKAKIGNRILSHLQMNTDGMDRYLECAEVEQLPGAYLCCSFYQKDMNDAFTRMGIFMGAGKGVIEGTILSQRDSTLANYKKLVAGHNLPGPVIRHFYDKALEAQDLEYVLNAFEAAFSKEFLQVQAIQEKGDRFYVIGLSIQNMKSHQSVVSHEIFHAQYFLDERYREIINRFWMDSVQDEDKRRILEIIAQAYNASREELVIDEFQAYILQAGAAEDRMKAFVSRYQLPLMNELSKHGILLIRAH